MSSVSQNKDYRSVITGSKEAYETSVKKGDKKAEINALNSLANAFVELRTYDTALIYAKKCREICLNYDYKEGRAHMYYNMAAALYPAGLVKNKEAHQNFKNALQDFQDLGDKRMIANCYNGIGNIFIDLRDAPLALENHLKAKRIREEIGDKEGLIKSYHNLANLNYLNRSLEYRKEVLRLSIELGDKYKIARAYSFLGRAAMSCDSLEQAIACCHRSKTLYKELKDDEGVANCDYFLGMAYEIKSRNESVDSNNFKTACNYFNVALPVFDASHDSSSLAECLLAIGKLSLRKGDKVSITYLTRSLEVANNIRYLVLGQAVSGELSKIYEKRGDINKAFYYQKLVNQNSDELARVDMNYKKFAVEISSAIDQKEREINILNREKEKKEALAASEKKQRQIIYISVSILLCLIALVAFLIFRNFKQKQLARLEAIEKEKIKADLDLLKNQISPHVMFNSLNTIYFQMDEDTANAKEMLMQFADLLRYQLYECNVEYTDIGKEIVYMSKFIEIQKLRKSNRCKIEFIVGEEVKDVMIAPLLMIPLVENAFKYVTNDKETENFIRISLKRSGRGIEFTTNNTTYPDETQADKRIHKGGLGLRNLKNRLDLIYPKKHELHILKEGAIFKTKLIVHV
jgi:tetratricopeptide (TPR) repeat protein